MGLLQQASLVVTPNAVKAGKLYSIIPTNGAGDLTVTRATTATFVGSNGLIQTAGNDIARLDYTNGICPSVLVEPQRTNLLLYSNDFTNGWSTVEGVSLTPNVATSPDGTTNASRLSETAFNDVHRTYRTAFAITTDVNYSYSFFVKKENNIRYVRLIINRSNSTSVWVGAQFDLDTSTFTNNIGSGGSAVFVGASITSLNNGWFRITVTGSITGTSVFAVLALSNGVALQSTDSRGCNVYFGNINNSILYYGAQFELGSNTTSYIPTTSASVTRNIDSINKAGINSLIGQAEGTIYTYLSFKEGGERFNGVELFGNSNNRIYISKDTTDRIILGGNINGVVLQSNPYSSNYGFFKVAMIYNSTELKIYINGSLFQTRSFATNFSTPLTTLNLRIANNNLYNFQGELKNYMLWKTQISDTQAIQLTTL